MLKTIRDLYGLLDVDERSGAALVIVVSIMAGLFDVLGVASIMPFMVIVSDPDFLLKNGFLSQVYLFFNFSNYHEFAFYYGIFTLSLFVLSLVAKAGSHYLSQSFILQREAAISFRVLKKYSSKEFAWFLDKNGSDLSKNILSEVAAVIHNGFIPFIQIISGSVVMLGVIILIAYIDPVAMIAMFVVFSSFFIFSYMFFRGHLLSSGLNRMESNERRYKTVSSMFNAVKEVKANQVEKYFVEDFGRASRKYADSLINLTMITQLPKFLVEGLVFGLVVFLLVYNLYTTGNITEVLPELSLFVMAGYRVLPAVQNIYGAFGQLRYIGDAIEQISFVKPNDDSFVKHNDDSSFNSGALKPASVMMDGLWFKYPGIEDWVLKNINVRLLRGEITGFVGLSGSGKTTLVDVVAGILHPIVKEGENIVVPAPQLHTEAIGYVSQNPFIYDGTVKENIAFGEPIESVDVERITEAAKISQIHEFIVGSLDCGYDSLVGENGVRLSGGQKQRIAIARALYKQPSLLILDESTSAMDARTEKVFLRSLNQIKRDLIIVMITHRTASIRQCDKLYVLEHGCVRSSGTYDELASSDLLFNELIDVLNNEEGNVDGNRCEL